ncbi:MAG: hypothetical protein FWC41_09040 [Firmicutes bacterium]|nr:hypothetical protein [Bacillota bacterium]
MKINWIMYNKETYRILKTSSHYGDVISLIGNTEDVFGVPLKNFGWVLANATGEKETEIKRKIKVANFL